MDDGPDAVNPWPSSISCSIDGRYIIASWKDVYMSSDYGRTWIKNADLNDISYVSMSASGKYIAAVGKSTRHLSSDYGETWSSMPFIYGKLAIISSGIPI